MKYRVVIIEDEKYAAKFVAGLVQDNALDMEVVGVLESVEEGIKQLPVLAPDLVLADIHLEDGLSFKIFETLQWKKPVIFITAYDAYAIRAFKVNGIDYLLKPIDEEALVSALQKFRGTTFSGNFQELFSKLQNRGGDIYRSVLPSLLAQGWYPSRYMILPISITRIKTSSLFATLVRNILMPKA
jgi:DNA-binding LytR/AlgR family response regulator